MRDISSAHRRPRSLALLAAAALLASCGSTAPDAPPAVAAPGAAAVWVTSGDHTRLLARGDDIAFDAAPAAALHIEVDVQRRYQTMAGFGASLTDSSAWLIARLPAAQRKALLEELFGRGPGGIGLEVARLTIGASDFSRQHYSLDDRPAGESDPTLANFSIDANRADVLPVIREALAVNPALKVMASPWSAPGWMKTSGSLVQGSLRPDMHDAFARYLVRYVQAYAAEGVPIFALTVQNEPHFEPPDYPGMRIDPPARAALIGRHLGPLLRAQGLATQILEWDHNWDDPQAPLTVLADPVASSYISGVAWHCYAGDVRSQSTVHDAHPDKDVWFTECSGGEWNREWPQALPWYASHIVIGASREWARGVLMWNFALDEKFGPHLGGCSNCRGVVTIDSATGAVTRNLEYYALAHASKFVRPGAQRIGSTGAVGELDNVAFRNADDGSRVLVVSNAATQARQFSVNEGGRRFRFSIPAGSLATFTWPER
ncbi:MAG TPA: glycoside hydrolase family 30 beta sandwich domain-containing protein [Albitalea sp.]|nr:glycoside hydrolase family 30 beta sandwich domain-containing protein [Albitalea sp.]